ncbi:MAG: biotin transporter BioY [Deltaproteobacteria bacterium]|jgi:biotin transport system substrate-specific component|nr:biotin transporter BioY [Deltaproteobacteria bacterium]
MNSENASHQYSKEPLTETPETRETPEEKTSLGRDEIESVILVALWAALMAAGAWISIPAGPVPITLQTFFVMLAGYSLGPARGFLAAFLYVLAGIVGFPVFAGGVAGVALILGPTAGYALSFPFSAAIAGLARGKTVPRPAGVYVLYGVLATSLTLAMGTVGLILNLKLGLAMALVANVPFLPGDVLKLLAATLLARSMAKRTLGRAVKKAAA